MIADGYGCPLGDENVPELNRIEMMAAQHCECAKGCCTVVFEMVNFMGYELHLNKKKSGTQNSVFQINSISTQNFEKPKQMPNSR